MFCFYSGCQPAQQEQCCSFDARAVIYRLIALHDVILAIGSIISLTCGGFRGDFEGQNDTHRVKALLSASLSHIHFSTRTTRQSSTTEQWTQTHSTVIHGHPEKINEPRQTLHKPHFTRNSNVTQQNKRTDVWVCHHLSLFPTHPSIVSSASLLKQIYWDLKFIVQMRECFWTKELCCSHPGGLVVFRVPQPGLWVLCSQTSPRL